ncbi:23S rRNA (uracil(1939)-C(5))-methyltransferase RlmD [Maridesulfovibrio salexigens]|uniref:RNA methyltransferase, TrmA family n=1 Tax=Maridesulfovibrio salexigens (strain ATCC 14822 / DSM 2638 / NCIMB 8403 / VKM B-1763) TaxID=526222 RepID=C6BYI0_MARSD|nr:23S rRNA (uracil(1939)-C(5))-methyltransferase RlmD [Maridesulfovibrio salexigens]ACS78771.1 RNA methyltransferase, TrmA family [Maridesulfovibrio salexigens DSM 2638]
MSNDNKPIHKGDIIETKIESLAFGGKGIGRYEGLTLFVEGVVPGQTVRCEITKLKKRFAEARRTEILSHVEEEQTPTCEYFGSCGGCLHQDIKYPAQTFWKGRQVCETLERIGKIGPDTPGMGEEALPSPLEYGYRNKMEFSFHGIGDSLKLGFKRRGSETDVLNISSCPLLPEQCADIPALVRDYCAHTNIGAYRHNRGGYWRKLVVRFSHHSGEMMIHLLTGPARSHHTIKGLGKLLFDNIPQLKSFVHSTRKGRADLATGERLISVTGQEHITETLTHADGSEVSYRITPNAFFQTNSKGAEVLYRKSSELAAPKADDVVWDLFCGSGGIGMFMAKDVGKMIGIEVSEESVQSAKDNAALNGLENTQYIVGNLASEKGLPEDLPHPDMVIVDPPRSGVPDPSLQKLIELGPEKILYISCNPSTLARDAAKMEGRYKLERFAAVDMFPHTAHVESIALLTKTG